MQEKCKEKLLERLGPLDKIEQLEDYERCHEVARLKKVLYTDSAPRCRECTAMMKTPQNRDSFFFFFVIQVRKLSLVSPLQPRGFRSCIFARPST